MPKSNGSPSKNYFYYIQRFLAQSAPAASASYALIGGVTLFCIFGYTAFQSLIHSELSCGEHITQARLHLDPIRKSKYLILDTNKDNWVNLPISEKIPLFKSLSSNTATVAKDWTDAAVKAKSIKEDSPLSGEEWTSGPWALIYGVESMVDTLMALDKGQNPPVGKIRSRPDGQIVANIFPYNIYHHLLLSGIRAEVWMQKSVNENNFNEHIAQVLSLIHI